MRNKTATEWLEEARASGADWVDAAICNIKAQPKYRHRLDFYVTLSLVVQKEFFWPDTPEGRIYWSEINNRILKAGK